MATKQLPGFAGEAWASDLQKLALVGGSGEVLGHLYLDLYARCDLDGFSKDHVPKRFVTPRSCDCHPCCRQVACRRCHACLLPSVSCRTPRCCSSHTSCNTWYHQSSVPYRPGKVQGAGVQYTLVNGRALPGGGGYQRPAVALVCNFPPGGATPLSVVAVQTLFHEFGHVRRCLGLGRAV